ncbi:hypothetical protein HYC85_030787 [Camellia sinensis]|uniref:Uncharacterized protein n=1 Tax=Camellia sinensis TaxID=4442 RepID=A0A7J7G5P7_CAMSI|nr:hypothetical protein HYC85_030787 [Camellia sinensis]
MAQNSEEIVVMVAALNQGITLQDETDVEVPHPPRSPAARPIWEPQLFQTREPTTFELMGMIGDLQRSVADLAYGMSAPPPTASYVGNFMPQEPPLLGRIVIELSQPKAVSNSSNDVLTTTGLRTKATTQTSHQAEASGKNKMRADALKAGGLNKQQVLAVLAKTVDDIFPTQTESSSSQRENRDRDRHIRTVPSHPNPALGKDQRAKAAPADPFASATSKGPQTSKAFHALYMPLSKALQILTRKGHLKPLEPRPLPSNLPLSHDATQYCVYHQQAGHTTDNCFRLRHEVQDLIDDKVILPPSSTKSVTTEFVDFEDNTRVGPPAGGARFTSDVAYGTHCFEHLQMLAFVVSDSGVELSVSVLKPVTPEDLNETAKHLSNKGQKTSDNALEESKTKIGKNAKSQKGGKKKVLPENN